MIRKNGSADLWGGADGMGSPNATEKKVSDEKGPYSVIQGTSERKDLQGACSENGKDFSKKEPTKIE